MARDHTGDGPVGGPTGGPAGRPRNGRGGGSPPRPRPRPGGSGNGNGPQGLPGISVTGRRAGTFCLLLIVALCAQATRVQVFRAKELNHNPANQRPVIERYSQPRGNIRVGADTVTGSAPTGGRYDYKRTYTAGPLYAAVTGYSSQAYGNSQLEGTEDALLSGIDTRLASWAVWDAVARRQNPGGDVYTTIDRAAQEAAMRALGDQKGAVVAIEPATGRILALASTPTYDPGSFSGAVSADQAAWNRLQADTDQPMLNRALRQTYPPGSTFKVVTAAAALQHGVVTDVDAPTAAPYPYVLPGTTTPLPNDTPACDRPGLSLDAAMVHSCNSVLGYLGVQVGLEGMVAMAENFGFNDARLDLPVRPARSVFDTEMDQAQLALSSIGQYDTAATPLVMAMVAAGIADNGTVMRPQLVDKLTRSDGTTVQLMQPTAYRRAVTPAVAGQVQRLMVDVVETGTGRNARIAGAVVGGKTGTAQHGADNSGTPYAWFISWAKPAGSGAVPPVAVAVVIADSNATDVTGGGLAAPVARAVMQAVLSG
ncbi:penicillin-binding transpeptidase domain-containing protein [Kitasatospora sp. CM 4170]|uniref:Penicillin-binding transpeptidase domain-containing protein n=1 Tax=Kitasatospora aburaviensis TaxID=67265 RepID=A0ABW1F4H1_9ACTN|nr:penicillin-binding transpeptidase domain-containing protein [Kitasatospora sp. CM 4170]WNM47379.1 penicillin-binding transpeptidase domain-containing protein [Kitasatospora sp. CM 4170]